MITETLLSFEVLPLLGLAFENGRFKSLSLVIGVVTTIGGILLMMWHQQTYHHEYYATKSEKIRLFELRKFRRRTTASSMIAAIGVVLSAIYWASDPRVFAILIFLVLILLLAVLGLACLDLFSVGLQQLAAPNDAARKKLVAEYLKRREQKLADEPQDE